MVELSTTVYLFIGGVVAFGIGMAFYLGMIPYGATKKGEFDAPKAPNSWLLSTEFGWDTIKKIDTTTHKTLVYLTNMTDPIETIEFGKNAWVLHSIGGLAGGRNVIIHLDESYINSTLRAILSNGLRAEQKEHITRQNSEIRRLKRENEHLRRDAKGYLADVTDTIKTMNKNTSAGFAHYKNQPGSGGGDD